MNRSDLVKYIQGLGINNPTEAQIQEFANILGVSLDQQPIEGLKLASGIPNVNQELNVNTDIAAPTASALSQMTAAPTDFAIDPTSALASFNPQQSMVQKALKDKLPSKQQIQNAGSLVGGILQQYGTINGESPRAAALGGSLQGAISGYNMAGIGGGIIGAGLGGTMAWVGAKEQQAARDYQRMQEDNARLLAASVSPTQYADGGEINKQKIRNSNIGFNSDTAKELWKTQLGESVVEIKADDGNMYKLVRRNDGSYDYYNPNDDATNLIRRGATAYEGIKNPVTKALVGFVTGASNYRDYQNTYNNFSQNPSVGNGLELTYDAFMSSPIMGGVAAKGLKYVPILKRLVYPNLVKEAAEDILDNSYDRVKPYMREYKNYPIQLANGGEVMDGQGNIGIQTEVGERIVLPNGDIVQVKSDELHKKMSKDKITDFVPEGSVVFSAKREKGNLINPKDYKDEIMGYSAIHYDENDNKIGKLEEIKFGDILGDKPLSPSEALEMIRKRYSTRDESVMDIFAEATNRENKIARMPYISALVMEQAKNNGQLSPQQFGYGGGVRVRKYGNGDPIYPNSKYSILNNILNNGSLNYTNPLFQRELNVYQNGTPVDVQTALLPSNTIGAYYTVDENGNPILSKGFNARYAGDPNSYFQDVIKKQSQPPTSSYSNIPDGVPPSVAYQLFNPDPYAGYQQVGINYTPPNEQDIMASVMGSNPPRDGGIQPLQPIPTLSPSQVMANVGRSNIPQGIMPPSNVVSDVTDDPYAERKKQIELANAQAAMSNAYAPLYAQLGKNEQMTQDAYDNELRQINQNITRKYGTAGATYLNDLAATAMQDPTVYGKYQTPYYIDEMYRGLSPSQVEQQVSQLRANANNTISSLIEQGLTPTQAAVAAAPITNAALQQEGQLRNQFYSEQNKLDRARYAALSQMRNFNDAETARVQQQTLANQNAITARLGAGTTNFLSQLDTIGDNKYTLLNRATQNLNENTQKNFQNRFNTTNSELMVKREQAQKLQDELDRIRIKNDSREEAKKERQRRLDEIAKLEAETNFIESQKPVDLGVNANPNTATILGDIPIQLEPLNPIEIQTQKKVKGRKKPITVSEIYRPRTFENTSSYFNKPNIPINPYDANNLKEYYNILINGK